MDLIREKLRARGYHRCHMGGDSESSSDQITTQTDARVSGGHGGAQVSGDKNTVMVVATDQGAVQQGTELARYAVQANSLNVANVLSSTQATFSGAMGALEKAYEKGRAGDQRVVSMVGLGIFGLAALALLPSLFKKG
jgi:hypothetical protein